MKRVLLAITVGLTVFGMVFGLAAGLNVGADQLGAGTDTVGTCDADGVTVSFGLATGDITNVSELTVAGIDAACELQAMSIELTNSVTGTLLTETVSVQAGGGDQVVTLSSLVAAADITGVNVTITG